VCSNQKLLDQFIEANKLLESVQKGLADYLETKRLAFARCVPPRTVLSCRLSSCSPPAATGV
jgi:hypothetical protein